MINTYKIINDPVHGFINIPSGLIQEITEHHYFQRLRDIKQLGLTSLVYPGATHSRLLHALGAMHLMREAIINLRSKGTDIDRLEEEAALAAILLHDVGHGPFSHTLEKNILQGISHEEISLAMLREMNRQMGGRLNSAIEIFLGTYPKYYLHQLVSSQLDVDRLDYLRRDSFFSGVAEGMIGHERILKMLRVHENRLVVEEKGLYSVEKFLISRRLMYWQVYLHKTVVAAEQLLIQILRRARELVAHSLNLPGSAALIFFLANSFKEEDLNRKEVLDKFALLDDTDIMSAIKQWQFCEDRILALLSNMLVCRRLPKVILSNEPVPRKRLEQIREEMLSSELVNSGEIDYFLQSSELFNSGYDIKGEEIAILCKDLGIRSVHEVSDMLSAKAFSQITKKYFLCRAKFDN
ncbi:MAG: HD domain-containing protein [Bacteroidales bacterium]|nr:HD domain-containing protein [Bacteroidales bacterium]MDD3988630.1 HD domain-containing protein [Bacteroidales bacterium]